MISLFMHGGPSHVDLLDPKPELTRRSGEDYPGEITYSFVDRASKKLFGSPWQFRKVGLPPQRTAAASHDNKPCRVVREILAQSSTASSTAPGLPRPRP